ncbi:hypothetical protein SLA2020_463890 [Shorea laevis]
MKIFFLLSSLLFFVTLASSSPRALFPPRGWNSYDSFSWIISEEEFLQNAEIVSKSLQPHGYTYVVVDFLWYRKKVPGAWMDASGFDVIDKWGRVIPDPDRWPSSKDGKGFSEVARKVHSMGLKFGIHIMRGISVQAYDASTPILDIATGAPYEESGRQWTTRDIGLPERACKWMPHGFMSVNTKMGAGRAFLRSLFQQYVEWGVDFVKHDCVFGDDLELDQISSVSEILGKLGRPIVYSLSPGTHATPAMAKDVHGLTNMYRITSDDWDNWGDVESHFNVARDFAAANMIGANGLLGMSWPDLDMLPLGWLTDPDANEGPHRASKLTLDEQRTQMTLWAMARSPLFFGGDLRRIDDQTYNLITNSELLGINAFSSNNTEFPYITGTKASTIENKVPSQKLTEVDKPHTHALGLTGCKDPKANGWTSEALDQDLEKICWKENLGNIFPEPLCLFRGKSLLDSFFKRKPLLKSDEETIHKWQYQGKFHLSASDGMELCLDSSPNERLISKEFTRAPFSPCKWDVNQIWELTADGKLVNTYSGLCATVNSKKANAGSGGVRSWIASGKRGQIYLAFFNLNTQKTTISADISHLALSLPWRQFSKGFCKGQEIWSGKSFEVSQNISFDVEMHGCALFVLYCS